MVRSELVARIAAQNLHLYAKDVEAVVDAILERMTDALANGDRVEMRGFGAFSAREMSARIGRNPRSGDKMEVAAKTTVHFKADKTMRARLNHQRIEQEDEANQLLAR